MERWAEQRGGQRAGATGPALSEEPCDLQPRTASQGHHFLDKWIRAAWEVQGLLSQGPEALVYLDAGFGWSRTTEGGVCVYNVHFLFFSLNT